MYVLVPFCDTREHLARGTEKKQELWAMCLEATCLLHVCPLPHSRGGMTAYTNNQEPSANQPAPSLLYVEDSRSLISCRLRRVGEDDCGPHGSSSLAESRSVWVYTERHALTCPVEPRCGEVGQAGRCSRHIPFVAVEVSICVWMSAGCLGIFASPAFSRRLLFPLPHLSH